MINIIKEICDLAECHERDVCLDQCAFNGKIGWRASIEICGNVVAETTLYLIPEEALKALRKKFEVEESTDVELISET